MFLSSVDIRSPHAVTIRVIDEMCSFLASIPTPSPILALALDVMVAKCGIDIIGKIPKDNTVKTPVASEQMGQIKKSIADILYTLEEKVCKVARAHTTDLPISCQKLVSDHLELLAALDSSDISIPTTAQIYAIVQNNSENMKVVGDALASISRESMSGADWEKLCAGTRGHLENMFLEQFEDTSIYLYGAALTGLSGSNAATKEHPTIDMMVIFSSLEQLDLKTCTSKTALVKQIRTWKIHVHDLIVREKALKVMACMMQKMSKVLSGLSGSNESIRTESEAFMMIGNDYLDRIRDVFEQEVAQPGVVNTFTRIHSAELQLEQVEEKFKSAKGKRFSEVAKYLEAISCETRALSYKAGEVTYEFKDQEQMYCSLAIEKPIFVQTSRLLTSYLGLDKTAKVYRFVALIRGFAHTHGLTAELSSYAWTVMAIHCLLRFGFLPNISMNYPNSAPPRTQKVYCCGIDVTVKRYPNITGACEKKLKDISIIEMLFIFFHYYVVRANIIGGVFTLRGFGDVFPKSVWHDCSTTKLWRLSIEDPFEYAGSEIQRDLAATLSLEGQTHILNVLRQGLYGIVYIIKATASASAEGAVNGVSYLFDKHKLPELSKKLGEDKQSNEPAKAGFEWTADWGSKRVDQLTDDLLQSSTHSFGSTQPTDGLLQSSTHSFGSTQLTDGLPRSSIHSFGSMQLTDGLPRSSTHSFGSTPLTDGLLQSSMHSFGSTQLTDGLPRGSTHGFGSTPLTDGLLQSSMHGFGSTQPTDGLPRSSTHSFGSTPLTDGLLQSSMHSFGSTQPTDSLLQSSMHSFGSMQLADGLLQSSTHSFGSTQPTDGLLQSSMHGFGSTPLTDGLLQSSTHSFGSTPLADGLLQSSTHSFGSTPLTDGLLQSSMHGFGSMQPIDGLLQSSTHSFGSTPPILSRPIIDSGRSDGDTDNKSAVPGEVL
jgi:hypothetical protein